MIRRILILAGIGLALILGARFALAELTERAWRARYRQLRDMALLQPELRRPFELRFESLSDRMLASERFDEIVRFSQRPAGAWEAAEPRPLDEFERLWVESLSGESAGLDRILAELRGLPLDELSWSGPVQELLVLREFTNVLCARAWLALEQGDSPGALRAYADALRLARATDDGCILGTMIRSTQESLVLGALRPALRFGLAPDLARAELAPLLDDWRYSPERAERVIRRDLSYLGPEDLALAEEPREALSYFARLEEALATARAPLAASPWGLRHGPGTALQQDADEDLRQWDRATRHLHAQHAKRNVAMTALAVAAHRARNGIFPDDLSALTDLAAEDALDPLTGKPIAYSMDGESARIGPAAWGVREDVWQDLDASPYVWTLR